MARTYKGNKAPGYEYWSKRPGSFYQDKGITHRLERREAKREIDVSKDEALSLLREPANSDLHGS